MLKVTYLKHSGFLIELDQSYLLFDYWKGTLPRLDSSKQLFVFASHVHHDHYTKSIFKLENVCRHVEYILSSDIKEEDQAWKKAEQVHFMEPHENYDSCGCHVETLYSTDQGVAFIVEIEGRRIYHAGDLHMWYWPGEPDEFNEWHTNRYKEEITHIEGSSFDVAFVVLDPRQEEAGGWGMDYFLSHVRAQYVFPMHCWENYQLISDYKKENDRKYVLSHIMEIKQPGQVFDLS